MLLDVPVSGVQCDAEAVLGVRTPDVGPGDEAFVTGASCRSLLGGAMVDVAVLCYVLACAALDVALSVLPQSDCVVCYRVACDYRGMCASAGSIAEGARWSDLV